MGGWWILLKLLDDGVGFILDSLKGMFSGGLDGCESAITGGGKLFHNGVPFFLKGAFMGFRPGGELGDTVFEGLGESLVIEGTLEFITGGLAEGRGEPGVGVAEEFIDTVVFVRKEGNRLVSTTVNGTGGSGGDVVKFRLVTFDLVKEGIGGLKHVISEGVQVVAMARSVAW